MTNVVTSELFDIVAHPDLIRRFTGLHNPLVAFDAYREAAMSFVDTLIEFDVGIEINVKGLDHPVADVYPSKQLLASYIDACNAVGKDPIITIGTDAHWPENLGINLDVAVQRLQQMGISEITTYSQGVRIPFALPDLTE
jgi:histidinol-phosphatase (PHP family)